MPLGCLLMELWNHIIMVLYNRVHLVSVCSLKLCQCFVLTNLHFWYHCVTYSNFMIYTGFVSRNNAREKRMQMSAAAVVTLSLETTSDIKFNVTWMDWITYARVLQCTVGFSVSSFSSFLGWINIRLAGKA